MVGITIRTTSLRASQSQPDQKHDGERGKPQVEQQFVGFVAGRGAVVARDLDADIVRDGLPRSGSSFCMSLAAITTAFAPARLAMAMETAGTR